MRSSIEDFLSPEARDERYHQDAGPLPLLTADQVAGVRMRALAVRAMPTGTRMEALDRIGREYGISRRSVERYAASRTFEVIVDGWRAHFTVGGRIGQPRQSSPWVKE